MGCRSTDVPYPVPRVGASGTTLRRDLKIGREPAIGRSTEKTAPVGSLPLTHTLPACASTSRFTIESPRPVPPCSRVDDESTW